MAIPIRHPRRDPHVGTTLVFSKIKFIWTMIYFLHLFDSVRGACQRVCDGVVGGTTGEYLDVAKRSHHRTRVWWWECTWLILRTIAKVSSAACAILQRISEESQRAFRVSSRHARPNHNQNLFFVFSIFHFSNKEDQTTKAISNAFAQSRCTTQLPHQLNSQQKFNLLLIFIVSLITLHSCSKYHNGS